MTYMTYNQVLDIVRSRYRRRNVLVDESSKNFKSAVILESNKYHIPRNEMLALIKYLKIDHIPVEKKYSDWEVGLSDIMESVKYVNPRDSREYLLQIKASDKFGIYNVVHHPIHGFSRHVDTFQKMVPHFASDFEELKSSLAGHLKENRQHIPTLDPFRQAAEIRKSFSKTVSKTVARENPETLDAFSVRLLQAFFEIAIPDVEGICKKCFKVSLPRSGFGIRYEKKLECGAQCEVRLSPEKYAGKPQQANIYVTNFIKVHGNKGMIKWSAPPEPMYLFSKEGNMDDDLVHIPNYLYNHKTAEEFLKSEEAKDYFRSLSPNANQPIVIPVCQCH